MILLFLDHMDLQIDAAEIQINCSYLMIATLYHEIGKPHIYSCYYILHLDFGFGLYRIIPLNIFYPFPIISTK